MGRISSGRGRGWRKGLVGPTQAKVRSSEAEQKRELWRDLALSLIGVPQNADLDLLLDDLTVSELSHFVKRVRDDRELARRREAGSLWVALADVLHLIATGQDCIVD